MKAWRIERKIRNEVKPKQRVAVDELNGGAIESPRKLETEDCSDCQLVNLLIVKSWSHDLGYFLNNWINHF